MRQAEQQGSRTRCAIGEGHEVQGSGQACGSHMPMNPQLPCCLDAQSPHRPLTAARPSQNTQNATTPPPLTAAAPRQRSRPRPPPHPMLTRNPI